MGDFDDCISEGFGEMLETLSTPTITRLGVTKPCVATPIAKSKELREAGYWPGFHSIVEMLRSDFLALKLEDRSVITFKDSAGKNPLLLKVIAIEDDTSDPCVKVTLKEEPLPSAER